MLYIICILVPQLLFTPPSAPPLVPLPALPPAPPPALPPASPSALSSAPPPPYSPPVRRSARLLPGQVLGSIYRLKWHYCLAYNNVSQWGRRAEKGCQNTRCQKAHACMECG